MFGACRRVVAANAVAAERLPKPFNLIPIELQAWADHEMAVVDPASIGQLDLIVVGMKRGDDAFDPADPLWNEGLLPAQRLGKAEHAGSDQRPARLVGVGCRRLDQGDGQPWPMPAQLGRDGDTRSAATDDQHGGALVWDA